MKKTILMAAILIVSSNELNAQVKDEIWYSPHRSIIVNSATSREVCYTVRESEMTPSTIGRRYCSTLSTFRSNWIKPAPYNVCVIPPDSSVWFVRRDTLHYKTNESDSIWIKTPNRVCVDYKEKE